MSRDIFLEYDFVTILVSYVDSSFWKNGVNNEIGLIISNHLPPGNKLLNLKWILKRKMKIDRTVDKYRARLCVKGFRQK